MPPALPPLSLYIHIPWCVRKCPYCDFNSHNAPQRLPQANTSRRCCAIWIRICRWRRAAAESIFFGGGTPSLFAPEHIARILDGVAQRLAFAPDDRDHAGDQSRHGRARASFAGYRRAGVNRISFGVQSFDDEALQRIGRIHDAAQAERAVKQAQDAGIENLNLDLMYALPQQTLDGALADVEKAILLQTPHLSHYQLTLEPNTAFAANPPPLPDEDSAWDMQEACQARLAAAGLAQYEVSAYARTGRECTHNLNYWRFGDYLGIGAGAHGKITAPSPSAASSPGESSVTGQLSPAGEPAASPHSTLSPAKCRGGEGLHVRRRWKLRSPRGYLEHAGTTRRIGGDDADSLPSNCRSNSCSTRCA